MSNEKFTELRLSGSAHGKRFAELFPFGPIYDGLEPIQELCATIGANEILRIGSEIFMAKVLKCLKLQPNVMRDHRRTIRHYPHTKPSHSWNLAASFYFRSPLDAGEAHLCYLSPNFMDLTKRDGTFSSQHAVVFSSVDHNGTNRLAIDTFVKAHLTVYAHPAQEF